MAKPPRRSEATNSPSRADAKSVPQRFRSAYVEAVAIYEQAVRTLQQHNYTKAADLFRHLIANHRDERELADRARVYLNRCERCLEPPLAEPENTQQRLYAATLALNAGDSASATRYLERVIVDDPANDQALYMLAVAQSERGDTRLAIRYLEQAIAANPENRALARIDPDLQTLRGHDAVIELLDASGRHRSSR